VTFTQRFCRRYLAIKEPILQGYIGEIVAIDWDR
jgi:predicted dehydrogenase